VVESRHGPVARCNDSAAMRIQDPYHILEACAQQHADVKDAINAWKRHVRKCDWHTPMDMREDYRHADPLGGGCTVINIKGTAYRMICLIVYRLGLVIPVWMDSHAEYTKLGRNAGRECEKVEVHQ